jgi:hypothetical protein
MRYDFTYIQALQSRARRERAEAMHEMLIAPLVALFTSKSGKAERHHAPRPHLARQG